MQLYNTLTQSVETFVPATGDCYPLRVWRYPLRYHPYRPIFYLRGFDILIRYLGYQDYRVHYVKM
jgi:hypothetical protein